MIQIHPEYSKLKATDIKTNIQTKPFVYDIKPMCVSKIMKKISTQEWIKAKGWNFFEENERWNVSEKGKLIWTNFASESIYDL